MAAANPLQQKIQGTAYKMVAWQLAGVLFLSLLILLISNLKAAYSAFAGGMAYGLPNLIFVWFVFKYTSAKQMAQFMAAFFFGEFFKLILSAVIFVWLVNTLAFSLLSMLVGYVGAIVSFWIVCIVQFSKP